MKASELNLNRFLSQGETQFVIPVYQRNYDWTTAQCKQLLDDVLEIGSQEHSRAHFIGSIVYVHDDVYTVSESDLRELIIIDGQQRLTTATLIYLVLYNLAANLDDASAKQRIEEKYLINKFASAEKLKLRPTENNDEALKYLIRGDTSEEFQDFSRLVDNYRYFEKRINEQNRDVVLRGLSKLMFVEISLDRGRDDPQRIFESLNSTGLELSQADLIRNYILMGLKSRDQQRIYANFWKIIEDLAKDEMSNKSRVSGYIRDFLTLETKKIPNKSRVYEEFKNRYPVGDLEGLENTLAKIKRFARYYNKLINPAKEPDLNVREQIKYINRLEINVAYPFLLQVYDDYENAVIDKGTFISVLETVQTFTWRRFIVSLGTNTLNKVFMRLYEDINTNDYLHSLQASLVKKTGTQRLPNDAEVRASLRERDMYNINSKNRLYFLERLENYQNKEPVKFEDNTNLTVEHIFPQNPDPRWKIDLDEGVYTEMKNQWLNTIGNLTLSGNNGKLSNKPFLEKREMNVDGGEQGYKFSRLWLNRQLQTHEEWTLRELKDRYEVMQQRFFKIWAYPEVEILEDNDPSEINIFDAEDPTHKKLDYAIFFDQKLETFEVSKLYVKILRTLYDLQPETFFTTDLAERLFLTKQEAELRKPTALTDSYFLESNLDSRSKFERLKYALTLFGFEDELTIKYRE